MAANDDILPSWREGATRSAILDFLAAADEIPHERRLAVFDNDGTLWCEKPRYTQLEFFIRELQRVAGERPELRDVPEYLALLDGDHAGVTEMGLERVALALLKLFEGQPPQVFEACVRNFFARSRHPDSGRRFDRMVYLPMLELMGELEARGFTNCIVTGGGAEFVRAISRQVYGVAPERVVGTMLAYELRRQDGRPVLLRTARPEGEVNEGAAKITGIQTALGRRPVVAAGNSPGDAEMLEYAVAGGRPSLALLVSHDDAEREYAYESEAGTLSVTESVDAMADRLGWTRVSMRDDWATVFGAG